MFSTFRWNRGRHSFGQPKKQSGSKRHHMRSWISINRKKKKHEDFGVMRSEESPPPLQASIPSGYDIPDDVGLTGRTSSSSPTITSIKPLRPDASENDAEVIEEAVPIVHNTLPSPESKPKIEKNGVDRKYTDEKKLINDPDDDPCIVKCVYFAQQCCECTIL